MFIGKENSFRNKKQKKIFYHQHNLNMYPKIK